MTKAAFFFTRSDRSERSVNDLRKCSDRSDKSVKKNGSDHSAVRPRPLATMQFMQLNILNIYDVAVVF